MEPRVITEEKLGFNITVEEKQRANERCDRIARQMWVDYQVGIVTGCWTRVPIAAGYSRVRVRVEFLQPGPYPYPQLGVGGSAHTFKLRAKSTQTTPDASFGPYVGMFSFLFFSRFFQTNSYFVFF